MTLSARLLVPISFFGAMSLFVACDRDGGASGGPVAATTVTGGAGGAGGSGGAGPTYHEHIAPILAEHCVSCHESGGIGPFPLDNYGDAASVAALIKKLTGNRTMPPFLADNSGECHTFDGARWLSDAELATLAA
ncbi:MAG: cytochrome c [Deltaproteobacteria bacterium]|nr:cytochrome c [Deltaproteobacteria bacterium]